MWPEKTNKQTNKKQNKTKKNTLFDKSLKFAVSILFRKIWKIPVVYSIV